MNIFEVKELDSLDYRYLLISKSFLSTLDEVNYIEDNLRGKLSGKVVIDLLLSNGLSNNRFVEAYYDGSKFDYSSFRVVNNISETLKIISSEYYKNHPEEVKNSILPNAHKFLILKGRIM